MRRMTFRVDPDVAISRVLNELADYYRERKFEEAEKEKKIRVPKYKTRHDCSCDIWTGKPLTPEDRENLRAELAGEIRGDIGED